MIIKVRVNINLVISVLVRLRTNLFRFLKHESLEIYIWQKRVQDLSFWSFWQEFYTG